MPTSDPKLALDLDQAHEQTALRAFRAARSPLPGRVGLEPELLPILVDGRFRPAGRVPLAGPGGIVEVVDALATSDPRVRPRQGPTVGPWEYPLTGGGRLTFEPGAQVEHSTAVHPTVTAAVDDVNDVVGRLQGALAGRGITLAAAGVDRWHPLETVPQQLEAGRYVAMDQYYRRIGPWGAVMMRHTTSLQLNLDLGPDGVWQERWLLANLLSPLTTATFASSPAKGFASLRARAWQELDPTRTGFPRLLATGNGGDPEREWSEAALAAHVMLVRRGDGTVVPCEPGLSFERWVTDGHPVHGRPTADDLDYHLTTLFFEVRPRGFLELRAGDALPGRLRGAAVALVTALLYDDRARAEALTALGPHRPLIDELWRRAAREGLRDPQLAGLARTVWAAAAAGMDRLPVGFVDGEIQREAHAFLERFTFSNRSPGDELEALDREDPALALAWASDDWSRAAGLRSAG